MLESGIVPEMYEYGQPPLEPRVTVPKEVRYIITVTLTAGVNTFASRWEPKPFGNGFKFIDFNTGKEMIVSGGVQIVKVNN
jgi:hypothetical protein